MNFKPACINILFANVALLVAATFASLSPYLPKPLEIATLVTAGQALLIALMFAIDAGAHVVHQVRTVRGKRNA